MNDKVTFWFAMLVLFIVVANFFIFLKYNGKDDQISGQAVFQIDREDLKECCKYMVDGEERSCAVLENYDCSFCDGYCS